MSQWVRIASVEDVPPGNAKELAVGGHVIALFHVGDEFYVIDGVCPHAGGPLGQGVLDGHIVTCPWHGWQFDVITGQHCLNRKKCQPKFPVRVEGSDVLIELPSD